MIEWTLLDFHQVMGMNLIEFFNLTLFNMDWNEWRDRHMKKIVKK